MSRKIDKQGFGYAERHKARWQYLRAEAEVLDLQSALRYGKRYFFFSILMYLSSSMCILVLCCGNVATAAHASPSLAFSSQNFGHAI
jgi:hypothetical protein